jgi:hypothetical protein
MTLNLKSALRGSQRDKSQQDLLVLRHEPRLWALRPERPGQLFPIRAWLAAFAPSG